jgi:P27 family predicted phage terminase small subunit
MGKRGPRKQPTKLRILRGNPSKEAVPDREPEPAANAIVAPAWLAGEALEKWHGLVPQLLACGVLTNVDTEALARYCVIWQEWKKHLSMVQRGADVLVMRDEAGKVRYTQVAPSATLVVKYAAILLRLEQEFGLTPSARTGIVAAENAGNDPLAAFLSKHG